MGYFITAHGGKVAYGVKSFIIDTFKDIYDVPYCEPGSVVYCIENGQRFILDTLHRWNLEEDSGTKGLWIGTEEEFNNLDSYDKDTFYIITNLTESEEDQDDQEEEDDDVYFVDLTRQEIDEEDYLVANKTFNDIVAADNDNKLIVFRLNDSEDENETDIEYYYIFKFYNIPRKNEWAIKISNASWDYDGEYYQASHTGIGELENNLIFERTEFK